MKNITVSQLNKIKEKNYCNLMVGVFSDNIENYVFPKLSLKWIKSINMDTGIESSVALIDNKIIFFIENYKNYANLFIMLPAVSKKYMPLKSEIKNSLNKLNINDQLVWFNDWWYLPEKAMNLRSLITDWINEDFSMTEIKTRTLELTNFSELEVKNLLTSHNVLAGSGRLDEIYQ